MHDRAAQRFAELSGGAGTAKAAREVASAYRTLAAAARGDSPSAWAAARRECAAPRPACSQAVAAG